MGHLSVDAWFYPQLIVHLSVSTRFVLCLRGMIQGANSGLAVYLNLSESAEIGGLDVFYLQDPNVKDLISFVSELVKAKRKLQDLASRYSMKSVNSRGKVHSLHFIHFVLVLQF